MEIVQKQFLTLSSNHHQHKDGHLLLMEHKKREIEKAIEDILMKQTPTNKYQCIGPLQRLKREQTMITQEIQTLNNKELVTELEYKIKKQLVDSLYLSHQEEKEKEIIIELPNTSNDAHHHPLFFSSSNSDLDVFGEEKFPSTICSSFIPHNNPSDKTHNKTREEREHQFYLNFYKLGLPLNLLFNELGAEINVEECKNRPSTKQLQTLKKQRHFDSHELALEHSQNKHHFCRVCKNPLLFSIVDSKQVCNQCHLINAYVEPIQTNIITNDLEPEVITSIQSKISHLLQTIELFRRQKPIDMDALTMVFHDIKSFIRQDHFANPKLLTVSKTDSYLKKFHYIDLCKHKIQITGKLNNQEFPLLTEEQEAKIIFLFTELLKSFEYFTQLNLNNSNPSFSSSSSSLVIDVFPKYDIIVYYLCQILGYSHITKFLESIQVFHQQYKILRIFKVAFLHLNISYTPQI